MCFIPPHYIIPIFPLCWMAVRGPDAKLWKQQHLASWQIPQADLLPASKLCLGLLHGLAADGLSGLPRASGSRSWLSFDSEDFTHFYSFVKKGPSKCFMKPTLENINGSNFAFGKAGVSCVFGWGAWLSEGGPTQGHPSFHHFCSKELGERPVTCCRLSFPQDVRLPGRTETQGELDFLRSVTPPLSFVFSVNRTLRGRTHTTRPSRPSPLPRDCPGEQGIVPWPLLEKGERQVFVQSELSTRIRARSRPPVLPETLAPRERRSDFLSIVKPCHCGFFFL